MPSPKSSQIRRKDAIRILIESIMVCGGCRSQSLSRLVTTLTSSSNVGAYVHALEAMQRY